MVHLTEKKSKQGKKIIKKNVPSLAITAKQPKTTLRHHWKH